MTDEHHEILLYRLSQMETLLQEIRSETRKTNGRVTQLELNQAVLKDREQQIEDRADSGRQRWQTWIGVIGLLVGGAAGELLHLIGV